MLRCLIVVGSFALCLVTACSAPALPPPAPPIVQPPIVTTPLPAADTALAPPPPTLRLPKNFVPTRYESRLVIDPEKTTFDGDIAITGAVSERSALIWLHGKGLRVRTATATHDGGAAPVAATVTQTGEDLLAVHFASPLDAGAWTLHFAYAGDFDELATAGAFRQTVNNEHYVYSQLEAIYARRVFPCVDEPDSKVPWQLTLDVPSALVALSNTPEAHREALDATHARVTFAETKPLPVYLVAFGVGPFEILDGGKTKAGVPVRAITLHGRSADAAFAAQTTATILDTLTDYFGIPYAYPKLDVLTIPITVGFGAMENAGLVTFSEELMLFDQKHPSVRRQYAWMYVCAHELAHQWFGDYVTTAWWDDIWLNEGFANWMEKKIVATLRPAWHVELSELDMRDGALADDGLTSARRIRQPIVSPGDIDTAFDGITYDKGASVLNMFESYVGRDTFQKGVRAYLTSRAFGNATSTDFIAAINTASGKDLTHAFETFLDQAGAPAITSEIRCAAGAPPLLHVEQRRYVPPGAPEPEGARQLWSVPMCVAYDRHGGRAETCAMLTTETADVPLDHAAGCPRWVMPNVNGRGYYHIDVTAAQVATLRDEAWEQLSWTERRALFTDVATAVGAGRLPLALGLSFVPKMLAGNDRFTIGDAVGFSEISDHDLPDDLHAKYEAWMRQTFGAGAKRVGLVPRAGDDLDIESTRSQLIGAVVGIGRDPALTAEAVQLAAKWRELPQAVRGQVLAIGVDASTEEFDRTMSEVRTEPDRSNREEMLGALMSVRDPARHTAALMLILDPKVDIRESMWGLFAGRDRASHELARAFFREHMAGILARIPHDGTAGSSVALAGVFTSACDPATRDAQIKTIHESFDSFPGSERALKQGIEEMDQCIARHALVAPEIKAWLQGMKLPKPAAATAAPAKAAPPAKKSKKP